MSPVETDRAKPPSARRRAVAGALLALGVLGPASARTDAGLRYGGTLVLSLGGDQSLDPTVNIGGGAMAVYRTMCVRLSPRAVRRFAGEGLASSRDVSLRRLQLRAAP